MFTAAVGRDRGLTVLAADLSGVRSGRTRAPGCRRYWLLVTTRSPAFSPVITTTPSLSLADR